MIHSRACWALTYAVAGRAPSRTFLAFLRDLDREDRLALHRAADGDQLGEPREPRRGRDQLVADAAGLAVGAVRVPAGGGLLAQHLRGRLAVDLLDVQL